MCVVSGSVVVCVLFVLFLLYEIMHAMKHTCMPFLFQTRKGTNAFWKHMLSGNILVFKFDSGFKQVTLPCLRINV